LSGRTSSMPTPPAAATSTARWRRAMDRPAGRHIYTTRCSGRRLSRGRSRAAAAPTRGRRCPRRRPRHPQTQKRRGRGGGGVGGVEVFGAGGKDARGALEGGKPRPRLRAWEARGDLAVGQRRRRRARAARAAANNVRMAQLVDAAGMCICSARASSWSVGTHVNECRPSMRCMFYRQSCGLSSQNVAASSHILSRAVRPPGGAVCVHEPVVTSDAGPAHQRCWPCWASDKICGVSAALVYRSRRKMSTEVILQSRKSRYDADVNKHCPNSQAKQETEQGICRIRREIFMMCVHSSGKYAES